MPAKAVEGFVVDPLRFKEKSTLYAIYSVLVTTLHTIEPELIIQDVEL